MEIIQKSRAWCFGNAATIIWQTAPLQFDSEKQTPVHYAFKMAAEEFDDAVHFFLQTGSKSSTSRTAVTESSTVVGPTF